MRNPLPFYSAQSVNLDQGFNYAGVGGILKVHVKPDNIAGADGDPISSYADETGNITFNGTLTARPTIQTNELNGHNVIRFDGTNDRLLGTNNTVIDLTEKMTIYVILKNAGTHNGAIVSTVDSTNGDIFRCMSDAGTNRLRWYSIGANNFTPTVTPTNWAIYTLIVRSTSGANGTVTLRENGATLATTGSIQRSASHEQNLTIGAVPTGAGQYLSGDIGYILIYQGEHTATEWDQVEAALNDTFAVY